MCDYCSSVLKSLTIPHKPIECQLRKSMYCSICATYGHTETGCPDKKAIAIRKGKDPNKVKNLELLVTDSDPAIRYMLKLYKIEPTSTQGGNKRLLFDLANSLTPPRLVTFVAPYKNEKNSKKVE